MKLNTIEEPVESFEPPYEKMTYDELVEKAQQLGSTLEMLQGDLKDMQRRNIINNETEEMQTEIDAIIKELNVVNDLIAKREEEINFKKAA